MREEKDMSWAERAITALYDIWAKEHGCTAETTFEGKTAHVTLTYEEPENGDKKTTTS